MCVLIESRDYTIFYFCANSFKRIILEKFNLSKIYDNEDYPLIDINNLSIIKGKNFKNILPALENKGFKVSFKGSGLIIKNFKLINKSKKQIVISLT